MILYFVSMHVVDYRLCSDIDLMSALLGSSKCSITSGPFSTACPAANLSMRLVHRPRSTMLAGLLNFSGIIVKANKSSKKLRRPVTALIKADDTG